MNNTVPPGYKQADVGMIPEDWECLRDDADYNRVAEFIADNPRRWQDDLMHPGDNVTGTAGIGTIHVGAKNFSPLRKTERDTTGKAQ